MDDLLFGYIGVDVKNYSPNDIHSLFVQNGLNNFMHTSIFLHLGSDRTYREGDYLQANGSGLLNRVSKVYVLGGHIRYTTDMDTYLLILRTSLLDIDLANELVNNLYYEGLIKPRNIL